MLIEVPHFFSDFLASLNQPGCCANILQILSWLLGGVDEQDAIRIVDVIKRKLLKCTDGGCRGPNRLPKDGVQGSKGP